VNSGASVIALGAADGAQVLRALAGRVDVRAFEMRAENGRAAGRWPDRRGNRVERAASRLRGCRPGRREEGGDAVLGVEPGHHIEAIA
jgi:hypothetical protein